MLIIIFGSGAADEHRPADIDRIAEENPSEGGRDDDAKAASTSSRPRLGKPSRRSWRNGSRIFRSSGDSRHPKRLVFVTMR
jgi:hypothetical protein